MTREKWAHLKTLFDAAVDKDPENRSAFIADIRLADQELAQDLELLIKSHQEQTCTLDHPLFQFQELVQGDLPTFANGDLVADRFRIIRLLGIGGMGEVYEAQDLELGRIALKTIRQEIAANPQMLARFKREVQLARRVTSPYVCRIHELFLLSLGHNRAPLAFLTMEFLEGRTLADRIHQEEALPWQEVKLIAAQLCEGLQAIHEAGVIHRDLKSHNVMLTSRHGITQAVIMDLGIAHGIEISPGGSSLNVTLPGVVPGTPAYMAPEQFEIDALSPISDIYSLGIVLYELLAGRRPFENPPSSPKVSTSLTKRLHAEFGLAPRSARSHWARVIAKCLSRNPNDRYQSAAAVAEALEGPWPLDIWPLPHGHGPRRRLRKTAVLLFLVTTILLSALGVVAVYKSRSYYQPPIEAQRWYDEGTVALREGTYLKAAREFQRALDLDKNFLMAHIRLADALAELDFRAEANQQMLWAIPELVRPLRQVDRYYVEAVRATLIGDYTSAVRSYREILRRLPKNEMAYGYLDLGRTTERSGDINQALKYYTEAISLRHDLPASFLRRGVLETLQGKSSQADADLKTAELQFQSSINYEGLAETNYQRGYAASQSGDLKQAKLFAERSRVAAEQIRSVQLETRALTLLSLIASVGGDSDNAAKFANTALTLAKENGLDYWAQDAFIRLGHAHLGWSNYGEAELCFQHALEAARRNAWPKLEANAQVGLATLRNVQGKPDSALASANAALKYFRRAGLFNESFSAETRIVRAQIDKKAFQDALDSSWKALALARTYNSPASISTAEELIGSVLLNLERYPEALVHLENARSTGGLVTRLSAYDALQCADALWHLGRFTEAENMLAATPSRLRNLPQFNIEISRIRGHMLLSRARYSDAARIAGAMLKQYSKLPLAALIDLQMIVAVSEARLGSLRKAEALCDDAMQMAQEENAHELSAYVKLQRAEVLSTIGPPESLRSLARAAGEFFSRTDKQESNWRSLMYVAKSYSRPSESKERRQYASQALNILSQFENNWGKPAFQTYLKRPDVYKARQELITLSQ
jgi:tetratricopeptide (TPR) repeat protein